VAAAAAAATAAFLFLYLIGPVGWWSVEEQVIGGSQVFLGLPCTVKHPITTTSPLYGLTLKVCVI
jgi:hypothetical protein